MIQEASIMVPLRYSICLDYNGSEATLMNKTIIAELQSKIWEHFGFKFKILDRVKTTGKETTTCCYCFTVVSYKSGITINLTMHMKRHPSGLLCNQRMLIY
ncbi:hypothetical protein ACF0H5_023481 [Mactra antiquata]